MDIGSGTQSGKFTTFEYINGWTDDTVWPGMDSSRQHFDGGGGGGVVQSGVTSGETGRTIRKCTHVHNYREFNSYMYLFLLTFLRFPITFLPGGQIPYDGVPVEEIETVAVPLTVIYSILSIAGIIFAIVCLMFTFILRNKKYVKNMYDIG